MPDLAFNELRFLKDAHDHQDEQHSDGVKRKPSNQEKRRDLEREEISAYFSRPLLPREPPQAVPNAGRATSVDGDAESIHRNNGQAGGSSPLLAHGELPVVPYLGFGSKGAVNRSSNPQPLATSYLTWSESNVEQIPRPKDGPALHPTTEAGQLSAPKPKHVDSRKPEQAQLRSSKRDAQRKPRVNEAAKCTNATDENPRNSTNAPTNTPRLARRRLNFKSASSKRGSASQSSPRAPSEFAQKQARHDHALPSQAESWHTSDILKIRERMHALAEQPVLDPRSSEVAFGDKEHDEQNVQPCSTSPIGKALQAAQNAMASNDQHTREMRRMICRRRTNFEAHVRKESPENSTAIPHYWHGHQAEASRVLKSPRLAIPSASLADEGVTDQHWEGDYFDNVSEEEATLDTVRPQVPPRGSITDTTEASIDMLSHAPYGAPSGLRSAYLGTERPLTIAQTLSWSRGGFSAARGTPGHTASARVARQEEADVGNQTLIEGLEGFWKPNRLY